MRNIVSRIAPWVILVSAFPALLVVNTFFVSFFPSGTPRAALEQDDTRPDSPLMQVAYVQPNRSPKEVFGNFYLLLGTQLAARGQILTAEKLLNETVQWMPDNPVAHLNYGIVLESLDKFEPAIHEYERAIELKPSLSQAHYNLGLLYDRMGEPLKGVSPLHEALRWDPNNPYIHYDLGVLYAKLNDFTNSAKHSQLAVQGEQGFAEAYNNYGYALAHLGEYDKALAAINQSLKLKPDSAATLDSKGFVYFGMGKYEEALAEYNKALAIDATIAEIHLHKAQSLEKLKRYADSIEAYQQYIKLMPKAPDKLSIESKIDELKKWQQEQQTSSPATEENPSSG
jgi:tetratricopeptide (TPR) repeat protein